MKLSGAITATAALAMTVAAAREVMAGRRHADRQFTGHVDAGGYRLSVAVRGARRTPETPAVVIIAGAGDCQASWSAVADRLAERTEVLTHDRAGIGWSETGPPPTAQRYLAELQTVLDACLPAGRHVLVGHSLGGLIARLHAQQHPERIAGLVQVDATPEEVGHHRAVQVGFAVSGVMASAVKALAPFGVVRLLLRLRAFPLYPEQRRFETTVTAERRRVWIDCVTRSMGPGGAAGPELRSVLPTAREAQRRFAGVVQPQFGDLPMRVLNSRAWGGEDWVRMHRELATRSRASSHRVFDDRFHNIHMAHPDALTDAVEELLDAAEARVRGRIPDGVEGRTPARRDLVIPGRGLEP